MIDGLGSPSYVSRSANGEDKKRKRMGIEPTKRRFGRFTGFEDRDGHQTRKRFPMTRILGF